LITLTHEANEYKREPARAKTGSTPMGCPISRGSYAPCAAPTIPVSRLSLARRETVVDSIDRRMRPAQLCLPSTLCLLAAGCVWNSRLRIVEPGIQLHDPVNDDEPRESQATNEVSLTCTSRVSTMDGSPGCSDLHRRYHERSKPRLKPATMINTLQRNAV
jgi:hypothetical protein